MGVRDPVTANGSSFKLGLALLTVVTVFLVGVQGSSTADRHGTGLLEQTGQPQVPPMVSPSVGNYTLRDGNGTVCMKMKFSCQMNITYTKTNDETGKVVVNLNPDSAELVSDCKSPVRTLSIYPFTQLEPGWEIGLEFTKQSDGYAMTTVDLGWLYDSRFVDSAMQGWATESISKGNFLDQQVKLGSYYTCPRPLNLTTGQGTLLLTNLQLQPFAEQSSGEFGKADVCSPGLSQTSIILIAACGGGALLLIIIVIVIVVLIRKGRYRILQNE